MEKSLEKCMDEIAHSPGVSGVLCADEQGLCLAVRGKASWKASGSVAALAEKLEHLEYESDVAPVILLESDASQCLIHRSNGLTTAIYKSPEF